MYAQDLEGTGSKLFGGRWNHAGFPCIYTSESRALAVLEYLVNVSITHIPDGLCLAVFEIDDSFVNTSPVELPQNWKDIPAPFSTKEYGTNLLKAKQPVIKIPSVIVNTEYNYIINPLARQDFFTLVEVIDFVYDVRLSSVRDKKVK